MRVYSKVPLEARLWAKVNKNGPVPEHAPHLGQCWIFTGCLTKAGYGHLRAGGRNEPVVYAHIVAYELERGPIPKGTELDHLCRNRACCNPYHLDAVPHRINALRGDAPSVVIHRSGRCGRGHERTPENTYYRGGGSRVVQCRVCKRERRAEATRKKRSDE